MFNNKIKSNNKILKTSFGLMISFSLLSIIFTILGIVTWNNNDNLSILVACSCGIIFPFFIISFCLYILSDNEYKKPINIVFIAFTGASTLLYIIGTCLFLLNDNASINSSIGMWFLIIGSFIIVFISFGTLIYYLYKVHRNNPSFEKVIKDPEY